MNIQKFSGLIAAPFTPMRSDGAIHPEMVSALACHLKENQIAGAFINGSTGEGVSLTYDEKKRMMEAWSREQTQDFKIIALMVTPSLEEAKKLAVHARDLGLYAIAILPPFYFKIKSAARLAEYCIKLGEAVSELPVYYYHIPALSGVTIPMIDFLREIHGRLPNFAGIKYTAPDLMDFRQCLTFNKEYYDILWGIDEWLLGALAMGAKAGVGSTYNYAAPVYHQLIDAFRSGNQEEARKWQTKSIEIVEILIKHGGTPAGKFFMKHIGLDCGTFREPVGGIKDPAGFEKDLEKIRFDQAVSMLRTEV